VRVIVVLLAGDAHQRKAVNDGQVEPVKLNDIFRQPVELLMEEPVAGAQAAFRYLFLPDDGPEGRTVLLGGQHLKALVALLVGVGQILAVYTLT
jgi:hypothetical protein